jgi:hypothetical protein
MGNPDPNDPINKQNPVDPASRSLFYGISTPPAAVMDGVLGDYYSKVFSGNHTLITLKDIDRRSLENPLFDIRIDTAAAGPQSLDLHVEFEYIDSQQQLTSPVALHVGLVDSLVSATDINVMRKLLLGTEGKNITQTWSLGTIESVDISTLIDATISPNPKLYLIAFVQDRVTKRIHQAVLKKINPKSQAQIVGNENLLERFESLKIYPNPASRNLNFALDGSIPEGYVYTIIDQRGISLLSGDLRTDLTTPQSVSVEGLANGIYFVTISRGGKPVVHRKIAVMNNN